MNDLSTVTYIKNDIDFVDQLWKHIHSYNPREIVILDTGSIDGTFEKLMGLEKREGVSYKITRVPHYTGRVWAFNKIIKDATSKWILKIDADELYLNATKEIILDVVNGDKYNCINAPTIHHFINSDLFFNCIEKHPDCHQRIFKREVFDCNAAAHSMNHGSIIWAKPLKILNLDVTNGMFHYSLLRPFKKLQKRSIINYYIDIERIKNEKILEDIELNPENYIRLFGKNNTLVTPAWQTEPTLVPFNDLAGFYLKQFAKWGARVGFSKPEDLMVDKLGGWEYSERATSICFMPTCTFKEKINQ